MRCTRCAIDQMLERNELRYRQRAIGIDRGGEGCLHCAVIVAAGNGKKDEPMTVKVGDTVLYGKYAGTEIELDGEKYLIMRQSDILAII